jgi:hypothetical protein
MDINKAGAWANVGSFLIGCITLYLLWKGQQHPAQTVGLNATLAVGLVFIIGLVLTASLHVVAARINAQTARENKIQDLGSSLPPSNSTEIHSQIQTPTPAPIVLDVQSALLPASQLEGRTFVRPNITPEYLLGLSKGLTSIQANKLVEPFIGNWMMISGHLGEVVSCGPDGVLIVFSNSGRVSGMQNVCMLFDGKKWVDRLSILTREDSIIVIGQISKVGLGDVTLENCELADYPSRERVDPILVPPDQKPS